MNEEFSRGIIIAVGSAVGGIILTILTKFADGWIQEIYKERERKAKHKINIAREVHAVCNEALTYRYQHRPRDMEHINHVISDVEGVDKEMGKLFEKFISDWVEGAINGNGVEGIENPSETRADEKREILEEWANKFRY